MFDAEKVYRELLKQEAARFDVNFQHAYRRRNLALVIQFNGRSFAGYQKQKNLATVQEALEKALTKVCKEPIILYGCSRTDAGVHAKAFVANFYTDATLPVSAVPLACQSYLPHEVTILAAYEMAHDFNARFSNLGKTYVYNVVVARSLPALQADFAACEHGTLDFDLMRSAAAVIVGRKDFRAFCAAHSEVSNYERTIVDINLETEQLAWPACGQILRIYVSGDGFLYNMVRIIAGTLIAVGRHALTLTELEILIADGNRKAAGKTMPPQGLCLERVYYREAELTGLNIRKFDGNDEFA